jgi:hypothetical protein
MPRNFPLPTGPCAGIPTSVSVYSLNITVTNTLGPGFISIYPQGGAAPLVSTLNYLANQTLANAAIVPAGTSGGVTVIAGVSGTDLIIDINGYYAAAAGNQGNTFKVINSGGTTVPAIWGETDSTSTNATGVYGVATATTGATDGVWGRNFSNSDFSVGVLGISEGTSGRTVGVYGRSNSTSDGATGVYGEAFVASGIASGVLGRSFSTANLAGGVRGISGSGEPAGATTCCNDIGVVGESRFGVGVAGVSNDFGIAGYFDLKDSGGAAIAIGSVGRKLGPTTYAFYGGIGDFGGSGAKYFVEPHPSDASKVIHYVSLEGRESGTYFRGTNETSHGLSVISVPEDFRFVTDEEGLTVQLTPVGAPASIYVVSQDLNQVVVRSSRDVKFHYMVNGVRRALKGFQPIGEGEEFVPMGPEDRILEGLRPELKRRLIANGTYNPDGTVNMETAERVGWTKMWAERAAQRQAAARDAQRAATARQR